MEVPSVRWRARHHSTKRRALQAFGRERGRLAASRGLTGRPERLIRTRAPGGRSASAAPAPVAGAPVAPAPVAPIAPSSTHRTLLASSHALYHGHETMVTKKARPVKARERLETSAPSASFPVSYSRRISAGDFKARCLAILEKVRRTGRPVLITRRGVPVAEVVPPSPARHDASWLGSAASTGRIVGDIIAPASDESDWEALSK